MHRALIALSVIIAFPSAAASQNQLPVTPYDYILSTDGSAKLLHYPATWTPSHADAAQAKGAVYHWLASNPRPRLPVKSTLRDMDLDPEGYYFQYVGIYGSNVDGRARSQGDRLILIHGAKRGLQGNTFGDVLAHSELNIMDGGSDFFEAAFDIDKGELVSFDVHGLA
jgi:hypothetical protein